MKVSIVIVSYNTKDFLKKCLGSIVESDFKDYEVIVVDNQSQDGTFEEFKNYKLKGLNRFVFIKNSKNFGFSKANNIGVKESKGEYILFLNPDTEISSNTLSTVINFMDKHRDVGASTCKLVLPNKKLDDACHRGFPTPWNALCFFSGLEKLFPKSRLFSGYHVGWKDYSKPHEIDAGAGAFLIVRREAGEKISWWDEDFFFYGEDLDLCMRLKKNGWKVFYIPQTSVIHYKGISSGIKSHSKHLSLADIETRRSATTARYDAMKMFYNKHYKRKYPGLITWIVFKAINMKLLVSLRRL